jgi:L-seryl-tRNA(Ser) seleniumtransferase
MLLLRDHGVLTVHFAALPPGTSALLLKFLPPETLSAFGGAARLAAAVDESLAALAGIVGDEALLLELLRPR